MARKTVLLSALLCALAPLAQAQDAAQRPEVAAAATRLQQQVVDWRRDFHAHPELSNREERTAAKVAELKGVSVAELEAATTDNFFRLFTKAERSRCA